MDVLLWVERVERVESGVADVPRLVLRKRRVTGVVVLEFCGAELGSKNVLQKKKFVRLFMKNLIQNKNVIQKQNV